MDARAFDTQHNTEVDARPFHIGTAAVGTGVIA